MKQTKPNTLPDRALRHPALAAEREQEELRVLEAPHRRRSLLSQLGLFVVVLALWPLPVINPVKLLVVLIHELSHVAAAYASGGMVFGIAIDPGGAGATLGIGGNQALIVAMGYAGSLAIGLCLYVLVTLWEPGEVWWVVMILACLSTAFGWINDFVAFFGYGTLIVMLFGAIFLPAELKRMGLRWVACTCCLYPLIDVLSELWMKSSGLVLKGQMIASDVTRLALLTGISDTLIGALWIAAGVVATGLVILWAANRDAAGIVSLSLMRRKKKADSIDIWANDPYHPVRWQIK